MAGDWIKMRTALDRDPRVIQMADFLAVERDFMNWLTDPVQKHCSESAYEHVTRNVTVALCVTGLLVTWGTARERGDREGDDLVVKHCDLTTLSAISGVPKFGHALEFVGWAIAEKNRRIILPKFFKSNETTDEKHKRQAAERQARFRAKQAEESNVTSSVTSNAESNVTVTSEERRGEESKPNPPIPPGSNGKKKRVQRAPETPLPADFEVFSEMADWAKGKGLIDSQIDAETERFIAHHQSKGTRFSDWEAAWRKWILNAIRFGLDVKPPPSRAYLQAASSAPGPDAQTSPAWWSTEPGMGAKGKEFGLNRKDGEDWDGFRSRIVAAIAAAKAGKGPIEGMTRQAA